MASNRLALAIMLAVLAGSLLGGLAGFQSIQTPTQQPAPVATDAALQYTIRVKPVLVVEHYRNGELIWEYTKVGDPLTKNFMSFVLGAILGERYKPGGLTSVKDTSGFGRGNILQTEYRNEIRGLYIGIGSGNASFTPDDYRLNDTLTMKGEAAISFGRSYNQTHYVASVSASFSPPVGVSQWVVREVGLFIKSTYTYLLARDVIPTTYLASGDQLIVTYRFIYEEPVAYNFAEAISRYLMAWGTANNGSTGPFIAMDGTSWPGLDYGYDNLSGTSITDLVKENLVAMLFDANGTPVFDMSFYGPQPGDQLVWSGSPTLGYYINSTIACISVIVNVGVPAGSEGDYLAVFLETDANVTEGTNVKRFAVFYTVFNPPLQGGNQYTVEMKICFG
ncbi:MAG: hypothetical protein F7C07_08435 [Desulfurococcales archaeon]|nr:hypothetical protein [Desulfurococcales archaeon]